MRAWETLDQSASDGLMADRLQWEPPGARIGKPDDNLMTCFWMLARTYSGMGTIRAGRMAW
jgi:hypothetical protein